ncbi:MAG: hypothetical protein LQ338_003689 [Usnochroma carphineum]|nr:MAG: hypothetical protein LQ338_003689 [Usnochroma carphineum]
MPLAPCCSFCGSSKGLSRCAACKITPYCSRDHQVLDRERHAPDCRVVKRARGVLELEEQELRDEPGDGLFTPAHPFETSVGHFWGIHSTRDYMRARYALVEANLNIKTFDAVKSAAQHIRDMLRLCRSDNMGVRDLLPALYLRLGRDQEVYDFIKWYETTGNGSDYDWGDMDLPYLDVLNADVFESPQYLCGRFPSLANLVCVALLKIRLILDLVALLNSGCLGRKLPRELLDRVKYFIPSTEPVWKNSKIMSSADNSDRILDLSRQVDMLYVAVAKANKHFWPALLNPGVHLRARPETYSPGSKEEMQLKLQYCFDSWNETPGAIDFIQTMSGTKK